MVFIRRGLGTAALSISTGGQHERQTIT